MARKGVDRYVEIWGKKSKGIYSQLGYETISTDQEFYRAFREGGYGTMSEVPEGTDIPTTGFTTDKQTDFYWVKRGFGDSRSYESYSTDIYGLTKKISKKLVKGAQDTRESLSANQFNNMTSTAAPYLGMDDVALVSTAHDYSGGTWSNRGVDVGGSTNVDCDLSAVNLELAIQKLMDTVNDKGNPDSQDGPYILYVPTALAGLANRLTAKLSPKFPGSDVNDGNWGGGFITKVVVGTWLTDDDAWLLIQAGEDGNGLFMLTHEGRLVEKEISKKRQIVEIFMTEKLSFFCMNPRGIWGSPGA